MKTKSALLAITLCLGLAVPAFAGKEQVMLNDGITGTAEILETTKDSIRVKFSKGEAGLPASRLDPHCFYEIRRKYMEESAENHANLALYCAENGLLNQARYQMKLARACDPEIDAKIQADKQVMEKIAKRLAEAAKRHYDAGDLDIAYELVVVIATRLGETSLGPKAIDVLDRLEKEMADKKVADTAARKQAIVDAADATARAAAEGREAIIAGLEKGQAAGNKKVSKGLRLGEKSSAKTAFKQAAGDYEKVLQGIEKAKAAAGEDAALTGMLDDLEKETRKECAHAYVHAGNIELGRESYDNARKLAEQALEVDPGNARAQSLQHAIYAGEQEEEDIRDVRERRRKLRGGGGRRR